MDRGTMITSLKQEVVMFVYFVDVGPIIEAQLRWTVSRGGHTLKNTHRSLRRDCYKVTTCYFLPLGNAKDMVSRVI